MPPDEAPTGPATIRAARPSDKRAVASVCRRIWTDDYVVGVFDEWVRDRHGRLWVACIGDRVVGVAKLTLLGEGEAWLHALRVDPRYQRRGVGRALLEHRLERARRLGARIARLDTSSGNVAVKRLMKAHGFERIERYDMFTIRARPGARPEQAAASELTELWDLKGQGDGLLHRGYVKRRVQRSDVVRAIREGRCVIARTAGGPRAVALVEPYKDRMRVSHIAGKGRALSALLRALPAEAAALGMRYVRIAAASSVWNAARAAGYRTPWNDAMLVFERRL